VTALLLALAAACSDDGDETSTAASPTTSGGAASAGDAGCADAGPDEPDDDSAGVGEIVDVDGDGIADTAWLTGDANGTRELGVATAAGGGDVATIRSASPSPLTVLAADADGAAPVELFVSDSRTVQLWAFADCALRPVTDGEGEPYLFDLGLAGTGTGAGCVDAGGGRELVGLNITDDDGATVEWSRTVVEREGLTASNGETETGELHQPEDADAIELLHTVSCGDMTIDEDGITQPET
jgi:hypothetical protein